MIILVLVLLCTYCTCLCQRLGVRDPDSASECPKSIQLVEVFCPHCLPATRLNVQLCPSKLHHRIARDSTMSGSRTPEQPIVETNRLPPSYGKLNRDRLRTFSSVHELIYVWVTAFSASRYQRVSRIDQAFPSRERQILLPTTRFTPRPRLVRRPWIFHRSDLFAGRLTKTSNTFSISSVFGSGWM